MIAKELHKTNSRRWLYFGRDPEKLDNIIDSNQYAIEDNGDVMLIDPGGQEIFPAYMAALSKEVDVTRVKVIFCSHQDPDVVSSLDLWLDVCPDAQVFVPGPWVTFIPHLSGGRPVHAIPDKGKQFVFGKGAALSFIPAHYLHSSGNFSVYDPDAKILFTGDIGAALLPPGKNEIFVQDFYQHIKLMEAFHKRWMPSNAAKNDWVERVQQLDINILCPQHGSLFNKEEAARFLAWFRDLQVGQANMFG